VSRKKRGEITTNVRGNFYDGVGIIKVLGRNTSSRNGEARVCPPGREKRRTSPGGGLPYRTGKAARGILRVKNGPERKVASPSFHGH